MFRNYSTDIFERNVPSSLLSTVLESRPDSTKYQQFPVRLPIPPNNVATILYDINNTFNPGTSAPYSGYAINVDKETQLRGTHMAYQRHAPQTIYIPSSSSDLYNESASLYDQPLPEIFLPHNPNKYNISTQSFHNHTRQDVKNIKL